MWLPFDFSDGDQLDSGFCVPHNLQIIVVIVIFSSRFFPLSPASQQAAIPTHKSHLARNLPQCCSQYCQFCQAKFVLGNLANINSLLYPFYEIVTYPDLKAFGSLCYDATLQLRSLLLHFFTLFAFAQVVHQCLVGKRCTHTLTAFMITTRFVVPRNCF